MGVNLLSFFLCSFFVFVSLGFVLFFLYSFLPPAFPSGEVQQRVSRVNLHSLLPLDLVFFLYSFTIDRHCYSIKLKLELYGCI